MRVESSTTMIVLAIAHLFLSSWACWSSSPVASREGKPHANLDRPKVLGGFCHPEVWHRSRQDVEDLHDGRVNGSGRAGVHAYGPTHAGQGQDRLVKVRSVLYPHFAVQHQNGGAPFLFDLPTHVVTSRLQRSIVTVVPVPGADWMWNWSTNRRAPANPAPRVPSLPSSRNRSECSMPLPLSDTMIRNPSLSPSATRPI